MRPAGNRAYLQHEILIHFGNQLVIQFGRFGVAGPVAEPLVGLYYVAGSIFEQEVAQMPADRIRALTSDGPIIFLYFALLKQAIHALKGFAGARHDHHAAHRAVNAVDDTQKNITGFVIPGLDVFFGPVAQRHIAGFIALNQPTSRFVNGYEVIVLK